MQDDRGPILLSIARSTLEQHFGRPARTHAHATWLEEHGACFVTLTQEGELRGCIGTLEAHRPLHLDVKSNAIAAAFSDPRFDPLSEAELDFTRVEVSLLSPMQSLSFSSESDALAQLRPGIDGVVFQFGHYRSTFLPQVWEQLPDISQFMAQLKRKAGLAPVFWAEGVRLARYTVSKWSEEESLGLT